MGTPVLLMLASAPRAAAATAVHYSVGVSVSDLKSGAPTLTITAGAATFSVAQAANVGVGDQITYNGSTRAYISGRTSATQYTVRTATGALPPDVASAPVNQIRRAFNSLSSAEAASSDAAHLGTSNLVAADVQLNWPCYNDGPMNDQVRISGYTTGASNFIRVYTPVHSSEVGTRQRHTGTARTGFRLQPTGATDSDTVIVDDSFVRIEGLEIDGSLSTAPNGAGGVDVETGVTTPVGHHVSHNIIYETRNFTGIYINATSAKVWNNVLHRVNNPNATLGALVMDQAAGTAHFYSNTVYDHAGHGIRRNAGTLIARNNVSMKPGSGTDFSGAMTQGNNVSSDLTAGGAGSQTGMTAYARYFTSPVAGFEDLRLRNTSLGLWGSNGADLSTDPDLPVTDDIDGSLRARPDIGADEFGPPPGPPMLVKSGSYRGNAIAGRAIHVGFRPDAVFVKRVGGAPDVYAVLRTSTMSGDSTKSLDNAGLAPAGNLVQSLTSSGFTVGSDPAVNEGPGAPCAPGCDYYWVAFQAAAGQLKVGTYVGDGLDDHSIPGVGFRPDLVITLPDAGIPNGTPLWSSSTLPADTAFDFDATQRGPNAIQALQVDGFQVGSHPSVNANGVTFHYVVWNATPGRVAVGTYTGDGADPRNVDDAGFFPEWVLVKKHPDGALERPVTHKPASTGTTTDVGLRFAEVPPLPDTIQALRPMGFQVGSDERVNSAVACAGPCTYHWVAFGPHTPQANYRSIGNTAVTYGTGGTSGLGTRVSVTNGSATVTGLLGTTWHASNRGRGDVITIPCDDPPACTLPTPGVHYTILSAADGSLLLSGDYQGTDDPSASYVIRRQFPSLQAWEDCVDGQGGSPPPAAPCFYFPAPSSSLVADDRNEVGIAYKDGVFVLTSSVIIDGSTTDATHRLTLTADPGNRHQGTAGAGVLIDGQDSPNRIQIQDANVTLEWLELVRVRGANNTAAIAIGSAGGGETGVLLQNLLVHDFFDPGNNVAAIRLTGGPGKSATVRNVMVWDGDFIGIEGDEPGDSLTIENCSVDGIPGSGVHAQGSGLTIRNTVVAGSGTAFNAGSGTFSGSNNTSSDSTAPGTNPQTGVTAASVFVLPNVDLHLKSGANVAVDTGLDLSSRFGTDVDGQLRPAGAAWDRGADERGATMSSDLGITKTDGQASAVPGDPITYAITVTNDGPDTVSSLFVNDVVPAGIIGHAFAPSAGVYTEATGEWNGLNLAPTQSVTLTLSGTIDPFARLPLTNTAMVSPPPGTTDPYGPNDASDTDTLDPSADVSVVKVDDVDPAPLGGLLTYTLTVSNAGPSAATNVNVSDVLPVDMDLDTAPGAITPSQGSCSYLPASRTVSCGLGNLGPALSATVAIRVRPTAVGTFSNTATTSRLENDPVPANDSESETTTVTVSALDVRFFTATSTSQRNVLEWVNPTDAAYVSTEIMVRGDRFPTGPGDGFSLYNSGAGGSGGRVKLPHDTGALSNGQTFYYGAFVHRAVAPLVSPGRFVTGRPFDHTPGPVKWAFSTGATALAAPTVGGAGVIATSNDRVVYAMERGVDDDRLGVDSGEWPTNFQPIELGGPAQQRSPVVPVAVGTANPVVYLGAQDGKVYVVDATQGGGVGFPWGPTGVGSMVQAAPAGIFGDFGSSLDYLLVGTRNSTTPNAFVALNPYTGVEIERWDNGGAGPGEIGIVNGMAAVDYGPPLPPRVYFTSYERTPVGSTITLRCFELKESPDPVWNPLWGRALGNIDSSPVLRGGRVYVGSPDAGGTIYSLDSLTGLDDRTFVHGNGQVRGFVFPDRASNDVYFATDDFVWGVTDNAGGMVNKFGSALSLGAGVKPSPVLFTPGSHYLYAGGSNGALYQIDVLGGPLEAVTLGNGQKVVGAPSLDRGFDLVVVGSEAGVFYAVQTPLPAGATCVQAAACSSLNTGQACYVALPVECGTKFCSGLPGDCQ